MKSCHLCKNNVKEIDWKNVEILRRFLTEQNKIKQRRYTHLCVKHQKRIARAIKRARIMALLPFV